MLQKEAVIRAIIKGSVFIYPTDTIYGIGCDATNPGAVLKIRYMKNRLTQPFSVIAPSKEWINEHCFVPAPMQMWLDKLPGPYTLVLPLKKNGAVASNVAPEQQSLGVRIPKHWNSDLARDFGAPLVTTSVNKTGEVHMVSLDNVDKIFLADVDFVIDEGTLSGKPSQLIIWDGTKVIIHNRG